MADLPDVSSTLTLLKTQLSEFVAKKDRRIDELEEQNRDYAQRVQSLSLELRLTRGNRKASVSSLHAETPPRSPASDSPTYIPIVIRRDPASIAATRNMRHGFVPLPQDPKYLDKEPAPNDGGAELRKLVASMPPSKMGALEYKPGRAWKLTLTASNTEDDEPASATDALSVAGDMEIDQSPPPPPPPLPPLEHGGMDNEGRAERLPSATGLPTGPRKRSLPPNDPEREGYRRKPICVQCWNTSSFCDFWGQCGTCRIAKVKCIHPGEWPEDDADWQVESGLMPVKKGGDRKASTASRQGDYYRPNA
ncbi:hypothetical protein LTR36_000109 [Oleoguttula mirabilis]|uniref:Uncharacterized protein n=1 Tax=Oleoguttula mirabilis TaxID=1507867 RepID=A0AAV9JYT6_9PEZI|nr:hypothetical protein LTR36_000109 [Oleoguttula mirabilis]